jgi:GntR family transcriptional regulator/MocR family aminotransferase
MTVFQNTRLQPQLNTPLYQQLYEHLRSAILSGQLQKGAQLPSTRALADELGVSRNTILNAYDQLFAEGYLQSLKGKGTFVTRALPEVDSPPQHVSRSAPVQRQHQVSEQTKALLSAPTMPGSPLGRGRLAFKAGVPALDAFPYELWVKLVARHAHRLHPEVMAYQDAAGLRSLREAVAEYAIVARQVRCTPEQVIITSGSQGGLHLAARVLLNPGNRAWIEDPGYLGARGALLASGAQLVPVPVDAEGLRVDAGMARAADARVAYVTPSHQFPLGVTMSLSRRLALLEWAKRSGAYILEDDYDSEYRFDGRPLASLQGLDEAESVIYIGTFSKVLFPSLRLGYAIVPPPLVKAFVAMRRAINYSVPYLEQAALADFIREGHFTRHIRRMRTLYAERRAELVSAASDLPLDIYAPATGMYLVGWLPEGVDDRAAARRAREQQVLVLPISMFAIEAAVRGGLVLGYAASTPHEIREGARRLGQALSEM